VARVSHEYCRVINYSRQCKIQESQSKTSTAPLWTRDNASPAILRKKSATTRAWNISKKRRNKKTKKKGKIGLHSPSGETIAVRKRTTQASLAWLEHLSMHITRWTGIQNARAINGRAARPFAWLWAFLVGFRVWNALTSLFLSPSLSLSLSFISRSCAPRDRRPTPRSSRMLRTVQRGAWQSEPSRAIHSWRHAPGSKSTKHRAKTNKHSCFYHESSILQRKLQNLWRATRDDWDRILHAGSFRILTFRKLNSLISLILYFDCNPRNIWFLDRSIPSINLCN